MEQQKIGKFIHDLRKEKELTQEQLAEKIGTKKTYISRLENGKADVQLTTLFRIFEGLGRRVRLTIIASTCLIAWQWMFGFCPFW